MLGIYAYFDKKDNSVVYVGKDSNIDKNRRDKEHRSQSQYHKQPFNRILQNNPNRYTYQVLVWDVKDQETLTALEIQNIRQLKPKFNFTDGGDGTTGYKHSEQNKEKFSRLKMGENNPFFGKKHSEETKQKMSESRSGENNPMWGKHHSEKAKEKMSENHWDNTGENNIMFGKKGVENPNFKHYARVIKQGFDSKGRQKYALINNGEKVCYSLFKDKLQIKADDLNKVKI